jgi:hypothetical protein
MHSAAADGGDDIVALRFESRHVHETFLARGELMARSGVLPFLICPRLEPGVMTATSLVPLSLSLSRPPRAQISKTRRPSLA